MINRFCMIQFVEAPDPDNVSIMHLMSDGNWVKYDDHKEKIDLAVSIFEGLKNVSLNNTTAEELNTIVTQAIEALK